MKTITIPLQAATKIAQFIKNTRAAVKRFTPGVAAAMIALSVIPARATLLTVNDYNFEDNATPTGFTVVGSPTYSGGQLVLDGSSFIKNATPVTATDNFGIEIICTPTTNDSFNFSVVNNDGANSGFGMVQISDIYSGHVQGGEGGGPFGSAGALPLNTPVRLALVRADGVATVYKNGIAVGTTTTASRATPTTLMIGANQLNATPTYEGFFKGSIDEVRVFTFASGQFNPASDLLTAPTLAPIMFDYTFNDNAAPAGFTVEGSPSYSGGQLVLDGTQSMSIPTPLPFTDNFGIEIICTPTTNDPFNFLVSNNNGANNGWGLLQASGSYGGIAEGAAQFGSAGAATPGTPVRLALVRAGGVATVYENGIAVGTTTTESRATPTTFTIGANQNTATPTFEGRFKGSIDQVRLFAFAPGTFNPATDLLTGPTTGISFSTWVDGTYVPALTLKGPGDDQDGDGLVNLLEFAFGTGPTVADGQIAYVSGGSVTPGGPKTFPNVPENGMYSMVFGRRVDYLATGLAYKVQFSADLEVWVDNNDTTNPPVEVATNGMVDAIQVKYPDSIVTPGGSRTPTFSRVKVELP